MLLIGVAMVAQSTKTPATKHTSPLVTVGEKDNGTTVDLAQDEILVVKLPGNPTTGYSWAVVGEPSPLALVKSTTQRTAKSKTMAGAPSVQIFRFQANAAGIVSLTLHYRRPWEHEAPPAKTYTLRVQVR
jgi:inhibitor of cysteine peptidase